MICPSCQHEITNGDRFCNQCGWDTAQCKPVSRSQPCQNPETGQFGIWETYLYPQTGEHRNVFAPLPPPATITARRPGSPQQVSSVPPAAPAQQSNPVPNYPLQGIPSQPPAAVTRPQPVTAPASAPTPGGRRRISPVLVLLPILALIAGVVLAFVQAGGFPQPSEPTEMEIPDSIEKIEIDEADMPAFTMAGD